MPELKEVKADTHTQELARALRPLIPAFLAFGTAVLILKFFGKK